MPPRRQLRSGREHPNRRQRPAQDEPAFKVLARLHGAFALVVTWQDGAPVVSIVSVDDHTAGYVVTPIGAAVREEAN